MEILLKDIDKTLKKKPILQAVNLKLAGAKVYGFEGINGSGKTMLMRLILGFIRPDKGEVRIDGELLNNNGQFPKKCGFLIEAPVFLDNYTARKNLEFIAMINNIVTDKEITDILKRVGLDPNSKLTYKKFSLGMKQRLGIAAAFLEDPDLVILDEPMNALDEDGIKLVSGLIEEHRQKGGLCIMSCHDREILYGLADEIIKINEGKIKEQFVPKLEATSPKQAGAMNEAVSGALA